MKPILPIGTVIVAAAVAIAGCGSSASSSTTTASGAAQSSVTTTVSAKQISGAGNVLVDRKGDALYTPAQEGSGMIRCVGGCTSIWKPLTLAGGKPSGPGKLGVVKRPDGTRQVTAAGRPLYSFAEDHAGAVTGNGATDAFGGRHFTWHVVTAGGTTSTAAPAKTPAMSGGYGY
jgi:predicted lipoprotein with Yx(FWY)xxD motif